MGTFLAPLSSPQPIFNAANDPEFSPILAMNDDDVGEPPRADETFAAADSTTLPAFFVDQHDQPAAMLFPAPVSLGPPPPLAPVDAAHHDGSAGASRPAKRGRGQQTTGSPSAGSGGGNTGQAAGGASARASRRVWRARTPSSGAPSACARRRPYYDRSLTERNKKASYSVAVQAVSDADGAFTNVYVGLPGSLSDAAVLGSSALCARCGDAGLLGGLHGQEQRLVGGASYPLTDWMLVSYTHQNMTWTQHRFNERVAAARGGAMGAVRRLKVRWRCLQRRTEVKMQDLPSLIAACCVVHNFCERAGEGLDSDLMQYELDDDEGDVDHDAAPSAAAVLARERIAHGLHGSHAIENSDMAFQL
ncbi:uncharacterized protein [Setaria viridis]|uniref:uncharacterized protein n=1 Tax=Setaria viridis TaxID=4556 RepID=UPI003B3B4BD7